MNRICYKVVRRRDGELKSAITDNLKWVKIYVPGKWAVGKKKSLLFVFNTRKQAEAFANNNGFEVWRCEVTKSKKVNTACSFLKPTLFAAWWKGKEFYFSQSTMTMRPGTRGCESLRLLKKVG